MTDQSVTMDVGAIVAQVRDLRAEIDRVKQWAPHPDEWPDEWVTHDHRAADQRQAELQNAILSLAALITAPHELWPGGYLHRYDTVDGPRLSSPYSGSINSCQPAWRSQHAAEAAVPADARRPPTVVWSPVGFTLFHLGVPNIELNADTWRRYDDWVQAQAGS